MSGFKNNIIYVLSRFLFIDIKYYLIEMKRKIFGSININESKISKIDLNVNEFFIDVINPTIIYDYRNMVKKIITNLHQSEKDQFNNMRVIKIRQFNNNYVSFYLPSNINFQEMLNETKFSTYFYNAFGVSLNSCMFTDKRFPEIKVSVINSGASGTSSANNEEIQLNVIQKSDLTYFRQVVCFAFGYLFNLEFAQCACYPQNPSDLIAWKSGLCMNCIQGAKCKSYLAQNAGTYDSLFVGQCNSYDTKLAALVSNSINAYSLNGNTDVRVDISLLLDKFIKELPRTVSANA